MHRARPAAPFQSRLAAHPRAHATRSPRRPRVRPGSHAHAHARAHGIPSHPCTRTKSHSHTTCLAGRLRWRIWPRGPASASSPLRAVRSLRHALDPRTPCWIQTTSLLALREHAFWLRLCVPRGTEMHQRAARRICAAATLGRQLRMSKIVQRPTGRAGSCRRGAAMAVHGWYVLPRLVCMYRRARYILLSTRLVPRPYRLSRLRDLHVRRGRLNSARAEEFGSATHALRTVRASARIRAIARKIEMRTWIQHRSRGTDPARAPGPISIHLVCGVYSHLHIGGRAELRRA